MALYYQNFYILVVFVPFLHTSRTFVLPALAACSQARHRFPRRESSNTNQEAGAAEPGLFPAPRRLSARPDVDVGAARGGQEDACCLPTAPTGRSQALVFLPSGQAHTEVYESFLKGFAVSSSSPLLS